MNIINKLQKAVQNSSTAHLPLKYRLELTCAVNNGASTNKLHFECGKKFFRFGKKNTRAVQPVYEMLQKADAYLYFHKGKKADFRDIADKHKKSWWYPCNRSILARKNNPTAFQLLFFNKFTC